MSDRKTTTELLGEILKRTRLTGLGKYAASEVTLDYGSSNQKRVDFVQFKPTQTFTVSGIEQGSFIFYEIKSCKADIYSGNGLNFYGDQNYLVMDMETWKSFMEDFQRRSTKFMDWYKEGHPDGMSNIGIIVAKPAGRDAYDELQDPTELTEDNCKDFELEVIIPSRVMPRRRSVTELLFCMLRSGL